MNNENNLKDLVETSIQQGRITLELIEDSGVDVIALFRRLKILGFVIDPYTMDYVINRKQNNL